MLVGLHITELIMHPTTFPLLAALALLSPSLAQHPLDSLKCRIPGVGAWNIDPALGDRSYNASGTRPFTWNNTAARNLNLTEPWLISVITNDTARGHHVTPGSNYEGKISAEAVTNKGYLSVPDNVRNTSLCIYQLMPVNATSEGDGSNGCSGVLSPKCMDYLRSVVVQTNMSTPDACADTPLGRYPRDAAEAACGAEFKGQADSARIQDAGNDTCTYPSLPSIDLPENYHTFQRWNAQLPWYNFGGIGDFSPNQTYDLMVAQSVPFIVAAQFNDSTQPAPESDVQFVCVTPKDVVAGSRVPENKTPWNHTTQPDSGAGARLGRGAAVVLARAGAVSLTLVL
ncbi:uncharacterized protein EKO05_0009646 [Ascochyta rabiei]|uniref:uncharacterized protein n=1 Tax=Didymella rabiei TaxID=5454 RepID=UPI0022018905|nr:uncharacterized protein EKO05_0009646 [Ascochyta rabiei]UPX19381.1 hypothetical protein EKO05_0009646 [Ascochyta rabiei]